MGAGWEPGSRAEAEVWERVGRDERIDRDSRLLGKCRWEVAVVYEAADGRVGEGGGEKARRAIGKEVTRGRLARRLELMAMKLWCRGAWRSNLRRPRRMCRAESVTQVAREAGELAEGREQK